MEITGTIAFVGTLCIAAAAVYIAYYALRCLGWLREGPKLSLSAVMPEPVVAVLFIFVLSRVALYTIGTAKMGGGAGLESFLELWTGPDSEHFIHISQFGYEPGTEYENLIVFYPLFPLLLRLFSFVIPWPALAGIVISNLCFGAACIFLYKLCLSCGLGVGEGVLAVLFMVLFPFSFFTQSCYTESLFLLLTIGCAYFLKNRKWLAAGIFGFLAALTRTQGVLCFAMAVYEGVFVLVKKEEKRPQKLLWLLLIPLGYALYLCLNKALYGSFFAYMAFERAAPWYQHADWIWNNLQYNVSMAESHPGIARFIYMPQLVLFFAVLGVLVLGVREKLEPELLIYGGLSVAMCYTASWLISGGRYMFAVFPVYMILARFTKRRPFWGVVLMLTCSAFLLFYMLSHLRGEAVM